MCLRIFSIFAVFVLLAACGSESPPPPGDDIECAIGAGAAFSSACKLEMVGGEGAFLVHHPDGGFRRFRMANGAIIASDGAAAVELVANMSQAYVEIAVDGDRYRIPNPPEKPS